MSCLFGRTMKPRLPQKSSLCSAAFATCRARSAIADGFTYRDGRMEVLNFSGKSDEEFASDIDNRLGGTHLIEHATLYSAYIKAHHYARSESDSQGNPWEETASALRPAFSQRLEENLKPIRRAEQQISATAKLLQERAQRLGKTRRRRCSLERLAA